jgi:hypothetical protein
MTLANTVNFTPTSGSPTPTPTPPTGRQAIVFANDGGSPTVNFSASDPPMIGDTGSGGTGGNAPAPASGDAAAGKFLKADGTWAVPPGGSVSVLTINGKTTSYTALSADLGAIIQMNSSSAETVTLPVSFATGFFLWVKNVGSGECTVQAASGNIDNNASFALGQWQAAQFYWDGSLWRVLSESLAV